ncbi:hypothetical protein GOP47_0009561 [Adiantum capillus-veneris]|uniref:EamA domain-containing protein n=1 Tax=Adiantum capillus-veneris TaxID=13818 RepID=A0A9D4UX87_ADICA|nr:hypothetical protein GOP47_0009561 [Adiantum capillus-veneris]
MQVLQPIFGGLIMSCKAQRGILHKQTSRLTQHCHAQILPELPSTPSPSAISPLSSSNSPPLHALFSFAALPDSKQESPLPSQDVCARKGFLESKGIARFLLLLVSVFWGTYGPAVRYVYAQPHPPSPSILTLARKAVSVLFFLCFLPLETSFAEPKQVDEELASQEENFYDLDGGGSSNQLPGFLTDVFGIEWLAAIELGLWTFLGTACQTDGLENTTATRAGFLLQSVTVLVPILSPFSGVRVTPITWLATFLALLGVTCISLQSQFSASVSTISSIFDISKGDLEILAAAFFYALCTVRLGSYAARVQAIQLSTKLMLISTLLAASWVFLDHTGNELRDIPSGNIVLAIIFSALVPGTLASLGQTIGQRYVSAAEAQVYFSLQPFFSAIFAAVILKEDIDMTTWVAGLVLFIATSMVSIESLCKKP